MKKLNFVFFLFLFSFIFTACSSPSSNTNAYPSQAEISGNAQIETAAQKISLADAQQSQIAPAAAVERKIIRDADLTLETESPADAQNKIAAIAESKGGFVIESNQSSSDVETTTHDTVTMTIRVPAAKFNESLDEIRKTATRVIVENVKGQDVTEEFIDIEARIKTQKALEAQFLEIMKRSNSVEEALKIQREIADVRVEIEKIEGRKHFLENQSSLSTVKITLQSPTAFSATTAGFFYQIRHSFGSGFDAALSFILVLITLAVALLPFLIFIVLPIYLIMRYFLKKNRRQKLASEIAREEIRND
jgi:uncharacterized lipoprotein YajG